ncbi:hypothetical protein [Pyrodictium abyssi]|uniref:Major facilitator superfamily (MFS) profile domain-containing protein n=1 Tax=Pyrodictium abyssi TaxID=54256 RepID=A0ABN6ZSF9_9CREN|nr:hypothetical protein PABY_03930 [Pyrodictium abyssi]
MNTPKLSYYASIPILVALMTFAMEIDWFTRQSLVYDLKLPSMVIAITGSVPFLFSTLVTPLVGRTLDLRGVLKPAVLLTVLMSLILLTAGAAIAHDMVVIYVVTIILYLHYIW